MFSNSSAGIYETEIALTEKIRLPDRERVCNLIGRQIFTATGVRCKVGGIRYSPVTENEKPTLAISPVHAKQLEPNETVRFRRLGRALQGLCAPSGKTAQTVFLFGNLNDCGTGVLKPYRPLTEHEQDLFRRKGMENNPLVIEALNIFEGTIVA